MLKVRELLRRLANPVRKHVLDRDSRAEMQFHLDMETDAGVRRGLSEGEARRQARLRAGSVDSALEEVRDERGLGPFDGMWTDIRQAAAALGRNRAFPILAGGALAASVAINTLIFAVVDAVIFQPLPYDAPERLVRIYESTPRNPKFPVSILNYLEDKRESRTLEDIALYTRQDLHLMHEERAERLVAVRITADFLPTLGVTPALGRNFLPSEARKSARVVILSDTLWRTRFGADPQIIGETIRLDREPWTVAGVLPAGFQHVGGDYRSPAQGDTVALWWPLALDVNEGELRGAHYTNAIARLKPGISIPAAEQDLNRILEDLGRRYPDNYANAKAFVEPLPESVLGRSAQTVWIIAAAGLLVLLAASVNLASLFVARLVARRHELAVRRALGGTQWRLVRTVLSESTVLGIAGGLAGLALAAVLFPLIRLSIPESFPRLHEVRFTWAAGGFAVAAALITSVAASILPALREIAAAGPASVTDSARTMSGSRGAARMRGALIALEISVCCVLSFGAILLYRSSQLLAARDHGFDPSGVLTFTVELPRAAYEPKAQIGFQREIVRRWQALPGVLSAGIATNLPWSGYDENTSFDIPGRPPRPGETIQARFQAADPGFLPALRLRLLHGRWFEDSDRADAPSVVAINETLASRWFPDENPVGRHLNIWGQQRRIVGVVSDIRDRPADLAAEPAFWWPLAQMRFSSVRAVIRTDGDPLALASAVRAAIASLDPELPIADVRTMDDIAAAAHAERRLALWLCQLFAALTLALAAVGLYGVLAYLVQQRRREIGIRMALGATRPKIVWLTVSTGMRYVTGGLIAGLLIAPAAGRAAQSLLYGVSPWDLPSMLAVPALLLLFFLAGSASPAWRAARLQPAVTLRDQ